ncbi:hypothetical protein Tco_0351687 [Tanacetum coccineum]
MHQFWHTITKIKNSSSYKFKLDKKKFTIDVEVFCDILQICLRLPNQEFDAPPLNEEIVTSSRNLDTKIDNRDTKKQEKMYYPKFTKAIIYHFISKDKSIFTRNRIFMHIVQHDSTLGTLRFIFKSDEYQVYGALLPKGITNQQIRDSPAYNTYLAFATRAATAKKARKFKKLASPSKKKALVSKKNAPTKAKRSKGIELLSDVALLEKAQLKKAIKRRKQETNIHQADNDDDNDDDDDQQSDDERTKFDDDDKVVDLNKADDEEEDEFLKDSEREGKGKDDEEMTNTEEVNAEHKETEVPLQTSSILSDYAIKFLNFDNIPSGDIEIISMMDINVQHEDIKATTSTTTATDSTTLTAIHQRLSDVENEVTTLRNVDHSLAIRADVKSEVRTIVKEYLGISLDDALHKVLQMHTAELVKEHSVLADVIDVLQQQQKLGV